MSNKRLLTQPAIAYAVDLDIASYLIEELGVFLVNDVLLLLLDAVRSVAALRNKVLINSLLILSSLPVDNR